MSLTKKELDELLRQISVTKDAEINCEECLTLVAEFADRALEGKPITEGLRAVQHHLDVCRECREEYEALQRALREMSR